MRVLEVLRYVLVVGVEVLAESFRGSVSEVLRFWLQVSGFRLRVSEEDVPPELAGRVLFFSRYVLKRFRVFCVYSIRFETVW